MKYYVGLDLHSATYTCAIIEEKGEHVMTIKQPTSERNLIASVKTLRQKAAISLVVEESHMAGWCQEVIKPYCDEFIVCDPRENKLISSAEFCNDKQDAIKLAKLLRAGFIKPIFHQEGQLLKRRELFLHYHRMAIQNAGNKMKLKSRFRLKSLREFTVLKSFPGIGDVTAVGLICMIGTPHRFSRKNKLWKYAGFGIKSQGV